MITKTAQFAARLLKKPDQCRMVCVVSRLFYVVQEEDVSTHFLAAWFWEEYFQIVYICSFFSCVVFFNINLFLLNLYCRMLLPIETHSVS